MRLLASIFSAFLRIGMFTFGGGYAMIPLIEREVIHSRSWIEAEEFPPLLALAQAAPGPIALNTAVFVGYKLRGWSGALAAVAGIVVPSLVIMLGVAIFFSHIRENRIVNAAFTGMRPAVIALIFAPVVSLCRGFGAAGYIVAALSAAAVWRLGLSPVPLIIAAAASGLALCLWRNRKNMPRR